MVRRESVSQPAVGFGARPGLRVWQHTREFAVLVLVHYHHHHHRYQLPHSVHSIKLADSVQLIYPSRRLDTPRVRRLTGTGIYASSRYVQHATHLAHITVHCRTNTLE